MSAQPDTRWPTDLPPPTSCIVPTGSTQKINKQFADFLLPMFQTGHRHHPLSLDDEEIVTHARPGSNRTVRQSRWCPRRDELKNKTWLILTHLPRHLWRKYRREGWRFDTCFAKRIIGTECCTRMDRFWTWFYRKSKKVSAWKKSINKSWIFNWSRFKAILRVVYISTTLIKLFNCYSIESNIFSQPTIDRIQHQSRCNP